MRYTIWYNNSFNIATFFKTRNFGYPLTYYHCF